MRGDGMGAGFPAKENNLPLGIESEIGSPFLTTIPPGLRQWGGDIGNPETRRYSLATCRSN